MSSVSIREEKDRLEILLPLAGRKSVRVMLWVINGVLGAMFLASLVIGLWNIEEGGEYLLPSVVILILLSWTLWLALWHGFGSEKITLGRNYVDWQHNFVMYSSPVNRMRWRSLEVYYLKEKKTKVAAGSYGRLVFKTREDHFKSMVMQNDKQSKMILKRIQEFFAKLKEESEREKDPIELLYPHRIFDVEPYVWGKGPMLN